jgi:hypothetical protein
MRHPAAVFACGGRLSTVPVQILAADQTHGRSFRKQRLQKQTPRAVGDHEMGRLLDRLHGLQEPGLAERWIRGSGPIEDHERIGTQENNLPCETVELVRRIGASAVARNIE